MLLFIAVSLALARPLPVQAGNEVREAIVDLVTREAPVDREILLREVAPVENGIELDVLAREYESFGDYVREVRVPFFLTKCTRLTWIATVTGVRRVECRGRRTRHGAKGLQWQGLQLNCTLPVHHVDIPIKAHHYICRLLDKSRFRLSSTLCSFLYLSIIPLVSGSPMPIAGYVVPPTSLFFGSVPAPIHTRPG